MKRFIALAIAMALLLMLAAGCSTDTAATQPASEPASQPAEADQSAQPGSDAPVDATEAPVAATSEPAQPAAASGQTFTLVQSESEARFLIDEVLMGSPKTVVGVTNAVEGSLVPDFTTPANTTVGTIRIDLSTLQTDSGNRTRTMHQSILQTGTYQYAEFIPTALSGMPESITIGQPFSFQITGNLAMHGVTREEIFDVTVNPVSETRLEGIATLHILYSDYGIAILRLPPQVASVEEDVILELDFVATPG